jgi:hypothetical protein
MNIKNHSAPRSGLSLWIFAMVLCPFALYFVSSSASQGAKFLAIAAVAAATFFCWCMAERHKKKQAVDAGRSQKIHD